MVYSFSFLRSIHLTHEQDKELVEEFGHGLMGGCYVHYALLLVGNHLIVGNDPKLEVSCMRRNSKPYMHTFLYSFSGWAYSSPVGQQGSHRTRQEAAV